MSNILGILGWSREPPKPRPPHGHRFPLHTPRAEPPVFKEEVPTRPAPVADEKAHGVGVKTLTTTVVTGGVIIGGQKVLANVIEKTVTHGPDLLRSAMNATSNALPEGLTSAASTVKESLQSGVSALKTGYTIFGYMPSIVQGALVISGLGLVLIGVIACRRGGSQTVNLHVYNNGACQRGESPVTIEQQGKDNFKLALCTPSAAEASGKMRKRDPEVIQKYGQISKARVEHDQLSKLAKSEKMRSLSEKLQKKITKLLEKLPDVNELKAKNVTPKVEKHLKKTSQLLLQATSELARLNPKVTSPLVRRQIKGEELPASFPYIFAARALHKRLKERLKDETTILEPALLASMKTLKQRLDELAKKKPAYNDKTIATVVTETRTALAQADSALKLTQATLDCWQGRGVCKLPAKRRKVAATSEANE